MAEQLGERMGKHAGVGVVFVHGFKSSPAMWDAFGRLMASDTDLEAMTPMRFQYATRLVQPGPLRRIPTFDTVADSLKEFMDTEAEGFGRLALVAHSQGGLVVQRFLARMLIEGRGEELKRIRRVVLFACPNNGSELGLKLRRWTLRANPQERQLRPFDEQITDTQRIVLRDIVNADVATERTCPIPFSVYAGETDNVVTPASARGVFPDAGVLPGDQFTIVRPDTTRHRSYTTLKRLLLAAVDTDPPTDIAISQRRPAITGDARELEETGHYVLPAFVARPHDHVTRQHFTEIAAGAAVELVLLRGGSCTGKTRTAYEAVKDQLTDWQLLQPRTKRDLITLLEKQHLPPRTVLWLDDVQDCVTTCPTCAALRL
ncbi:lipase family alpha/beta hydrolase [Streptomyces mirabilis]|uniref:lipase family alpha/beta hydrolase n=1 Tax=Streptomyces mirabilis TaxID=68239 RepID=UPI00369DB912